MLYVCVEDWGGLYLPVVKFCLGEISSSYNCALILTKVFFSLTVNA